MYVFAGLQIVYTLDEVTYVQNLVFYIETAYRTPVSVIQFIFSNSQQISGTPVDKTGIWGDRTTPPLKTKKDILVEL